jgi:hypothetical protein
MNAAVHTSARVHRCRDDIPGSSAISLTTQEITMMPSTLSLPLILADADAAAVAGMASAILAASSALVTLDFMVPPGNT